MLSDFGASGPYPGLMEVAVRSVAREVPVVHVLHDLPAFSPRAAGVIVAAIGAKAAEGAVLLCVVDPGVGTDRPPTVLRVDGRWYVGPDNGLFDMARARGRTVTAWTVSWRPRSLSATFHGRDLFAPLAARIAAGDFSWGEPVTGSTTAGEATSFAQVVYLDPFGNAMCGLFAADLGQETVLEVAGRRFHRVTTFADAEPGTGVWIENSLGLAELCLNRGDCARAFGLAVGDPVNVVAGPGAVGVA